MPALKRHSSAPHRGVDVMPDTGKARGLGAGRGALASPSSIASQLLVPRSAVARMQSRVPSDGVARFAQKMCCRPSTPGSTKCYCSTRLYRDFIHIHHMPGKALHVGQTSLHSTDENDCCQLTAVMFTFLRLSYCCAAKFPSLSCTQVAHCT